MTGVWRVKEGTGFLLERLNKDGTLNLRRFKGTKRKHITLKPRAAVRTSHG